MRPRDDVAVALDRHRVLSDLQAALRAQDDLRVVPDPPHRERGVAGERDVVRFAASSRRQPPPTNARVVDVDVSTQRAEREPRAVFSPRQRGYRVQIRHVLFCHEAPDLPTRVDRVHVERVERTHRQRLAVGAERRARKLARVGIVRAVVEGLLRPSALAARVVERELLVRTGAGDDAAASGRSVARRRRYAPRQAVRRARVRRETRRRPRFEGKHVHRPVEVPTTHAVAVRARRQSHHVALLGMRVQSGGFVGLQSSDAHFPIRRGKRELAGSAGGPRESGHRVVLQELVADALLVPPLGAQLVHEDDVVALPDGELRGAGRERHAAHDEVLRAVALRGLRAELVTLRAGVVEHLHDAVGGHRGQALGVGAPVSSEARGSSVEGDASGRHGERWGRTKSQRSDREVPFEGGRTMLSP